MSPADERELYELNREEWLKETAPRLAALFPKRTDGWVNVTWIAMQEDHKRAVWAHLDAAQRERVKRVRRAAA